METITSLESSPPEILLTTSGGQPLLLLYKLVFVGKKVVYVLLPERKYCGHQHFNFGNEQK